jgi:hypothetical protein
LAGAASLRTVVLAGFRGASGQQRGKHQTGETSQETEGAKAKFEALFCHGIPSSKRDANPAKKPFSGLICACSQAWCPQADTTRFVLKHTHQIGTWPKRLHSQIPHRFRG